MKRKVRKARAKATAVEAKTEPEPPVESDSESDDEDEDEAEEVALDGEDVDFDFCDPNEEDFHSVKCLLTSGTWEFIEDLNFTELTDAVCGQGNIGSFVKTGDADEEDAAVLAMLTALNLRQFPEHSWPLTICRILREKAAKHASAEAAASLDKLLQVKEGNEVGLVLNERFYNLPPALVPALHKSLLKDIDWSCSTPECPEDERPFYLFKNFVCVSKCYEDSGGASASAAARPKKKRRVASSAAAPADMSSLVFAQPEVEIFAKHAAYSFSFPVSIKKKEEGKQPKRKAEAGGNGPERRLVWWITRKGLDKATKELAQVGS